MHILNQCLRHTWFSIAGEPMLDTGAPREREHGVFVSVDGLTVNVVICNDCGVRRVFAQGYWRNSSRKRSCTSIEARERAVYQYEQWRQEAKDLNSIYTDHSRPPYNNDPDVVGEYFRPLFDKKDLAIRESFFRKFSPLRLLRRRTIAPAAIGLEVNPNS